MNLNFSGASSFTVNVGGWPARLLIAVSLIIGPHWTLALCKRLPFSKKNLGILVVPKWTVYREGQWGLVRHIGSWYSFQVLRANSDAQLNVLNTGVMTYPTKPWEHSSHGDGRT